MRDSESTTGDFSVSLKAPGRNKHFRVHVEAGKEIYLNIIYMIRYGIKTTTFDMIKC